MLFKTNRTFLQALLQASNEMQLGRGLSGSKATAELAESGLCGWPRLPFLLPPSVEPPLDLSQFRALRPTSFSGQPSKGKGVVAEIGRTQGEFLYEST